MDWVAASAAAFLKLLLTTEAGLKLISEKFNFQITKANDTKEYSLVDNVSRKVHTLENSQVWFFEGCLVDGVPIPLAGKSTQNFIPPLELEISDLTRNKCDGCGIVSHCSKEVLDTVTDRLLSLCNFCLTYHEHPKVSEQGGYSKCEECALLRCCHHPGKIAAV